MGEPVIKMEESPEVSVMAITPASTATPAITAAAAMVSSTSDSEDVKPPLSKPCLVVNQAQAAPSAYYGSSPHKYRLRGFQYGSNRAFVQIPPELARLPSLQASAVATGSVNKVNTTTTKRSTLPAPNRLKQLLRNSNKQKITRGENMDHHHHHHHDKDTATGNETNYPVLPPMTDLLEQGDLVGSLPRGGLAGVQTYLQIMQQVEEQRQVISELVAFNRNTFVTVRQLQDRVATVEQENNYLRSLLSPVIDEDMHHSAPAVDHTFSRADTSESARSSSQGSTNSGSVSDNVNNVKSRKQLEIQVPGYIFAPPPLGAGLPTPLTKSATNQPMNNFAPLNTPKTPTTPNRIGPNSTTKVTTSILKRKIHNLNQILPPPYVQIPIVPLTDTEVIVYFFKSLARPIVSLRLYARKWGPASIVAALNEHRDIEPKYLRNTCSVKCTTAIKKGNEKYGEEWEETHRIVFSEATDSKATDMIHLSGDEIEHAVDYDLRSLSVGMIKHPKDGVDGGIFTRCVKYCDETGAAYTMSTVWQLAADLQAGRTPNHPVSPVVEDFADPNHHRQKKQKKAGVRSAAPESVLREDLE